MLKKLIRANLDDLALCCGVVGGTFLLTHLVTAVVLFLFNDPSDSVLLSGLILPAVTGFLLLFVSAAHVGVTFPMALKFSQSRRRALGLTLGLIAFLAVCSMGLAALLARLEPLFAPGLWVRLTGARSAAVDAVVVVGFGSVNTVSQTVPEGQVLSVAAFSLAWYWFVLIAAGGAAAGVIAGALLQRFGRRGFWALWAVWMLACFSPRLLPWRRYAITDWLWPLVGAAALAALIWSVWSLLHTVVRE